MPSSVLVRRIMVSARLPPDCVCVRASSISERSRISDERPMSSDRLLRVIVHVAVSTPVRVLRPSRRRRLPVSVMRPSRDFFEDDCLRALRPSEP